jgi:hypothetical protein
MGWPQVVAVVWILMIWRDNYLIDSQMHYTLTNFLVATMMVAPLVAALYYGGFFK